MSWAARNVCSTFSKLSESLMPKRLDLIQRPNLHAIHIDIAGQPVISPFQMLSMALVRDHKEGAAIPITQERFKTGWVSTQAAGLVNQPNSFEFLFNPGTRTLATGIFNGAAVMFTRYTL